MVRLPFTLLQVDDESNDLLLIRSAVEMARLEWQVFSAAHGAAAISYLRGDPPFADRERHPIPKLVLLDLKMPFKNGFEVLQWMRQQPTLRAIPVVIFTSSNHQDDVQKAYECGANSYLVKPVSLEELIELLRAIDAYWGRFNQCVPAENFESPME
jgi:CheY-like chemotaxis protein